jgi:DNA-binding response OmpR family regulator
MTTEILLADDDTELCAMLETFLVDEGFSVTAIHDGETAQVEALSEKYHLVVLDIMLPRRSGLDVLKNLRQQSQKPVLILSARGDDVDSILGLELGADDYLCKPCNPRVLAARIRAILRRNRVILGYWPPGFARYCAARNPLPCLKRRKPYKWMKLKCTLNLAAFIGECNLLN